MEIASSRGTRRCRADHGPDGRRVRYLRERDHARIARASDDRTFVGAFQSIDRAIINPLFMTTFLGALVSSGLAVVLHLSQDERSVLPWALAAFGLYLWVFISTIAVNVPLNDELKAAGDPDAIDDLAAVRERFNEAKWMRWNMVRAVASTAAFVCLLWALVEHGQGA